jgi:hypothetical protein
VLAYHLVLSIVLTIFYAFIDEYTLELEGAVARAAELSMTDLDAAVNAYLKHAKKGKTNGEDQSDDVSRRGHDEDWEVNG